MTGPHEYTGPEIDLSSDSVRRVSQHQTAGANARLRLFALLAAQGVPAAEADDLVAALERSPGRRARWSSWMGWRRTLRVCGSRTAGAKA